MTKPKKSKVKKAKAARVAANEKSKAGKKPATVLKRTYVRPDPASVKLPEVYFDHLKNSYWERVSPRRFVHFNKSDIDLHYRYCGLNDDDLIGAIGAVENAIFDTQKNCAVDYAGPLAGHKSGVFTAGCGRRVLVTDEARWLEAKEGDMDRFDKFLTELLGGQTPHYLWWLKLARESLRTRTFRASHCNVFVGENSSGKSLLAKLTTEFLGGRAEDPYEWIMRDKFNGHLAGAEHFVIDDKSPPNDSKTRKHLGEVIKALCATPTFQIRGMGKQAITLETYRRLTICCNRDLEQMMIIPPWNDGVPDKIQLFDCGVATLGPDMVANWKALTACLPAVAWHVERMKIPKAWATGKEADRYGFRAYHNPELLKKIYEIAPENQLLDIIDDVLSDRPHDPKDELTPRGSFRGTANELWELLKTSKFSFIVEKVVYNATVMGSSLGKLARQHPTRFVKKIIHGKNIWTIHPPAETE